MWDVNRFWNQIPLSVGMKLSLYTLLFSYFIANWINPYNYLRATSALLHPHQPMSTSIEIPSWRALTTVSIAHGNSRNVLTLIYHGYYISVWVKGDLPNIIYSLIERCETFKYHWSLTSKQTSMVEAVGISYPFRNSFSTSLVIALHCWNQSSFG